MDVADAPSESSPASLSSGASGDIPTRRSCRLPASMVPSCDMTHPPGSNVAGTTRTLIEMRAASVEHRHQMRYPYPQHAGRASGVALTGFIAQDMISIELCRAQRPGFLICRLLHLFRLRDGRLGGTERDRYRQTTFLVRLDICISPPGSSTGDESSDARRVTANHGLGGRSHQPYFSLQAAPAA